MRIQSLNQINFKSVLPQKTGQKDGWDVLEKLTEADEKNKGMLHEQLVLLSKNEDNNVLALEHTPLDSSFANEAFSFRLYKNNEDLNKDRAKNYMYPQNLINKELLIDFYGDHSYKISYGQLYSIKHYDNIPKEKTNILLKILREITTKGTKEHSAIFGKTNFGELPKEIVSKFRL